MKVIMAHGHELGQYLLYAFTTFHILYNVRFRNNCCKSESFRECGHRGNCVTCHAN